MINMLMQLTQVKTTQHVVVKGIASLAARPNTLPSHELRQFNLSKVHKHND